MGGDPTDGPVVHAYGGDLVTWVLAWSLIDRVSDLDSVQRDNGRHPRGGGCEAHDVVVRLEVGGARRLDPTVARVRSQEPMGVPGRLAD